MLKLLGGGDWGCGAQRTGGSCFTTLKFNSKQQQQQHQVTLQVFYTWPLLSVQMLVPCLPPRLVPLGIGTASLVTGGFCRFHVLKHEPRVLATPTSRQPQRLLLTGHYSRIGNRSKECYPSIYDVPGPEQSGRIHYSFPASAWQGCDSNPARLTADFLFWTMAVKVSFLLIAYFTEGSVPHVACAGHFQDIGSTAGKGPCVQGGSVVPLEERVCPGVRLICCSISEPLDSRSLKVGSRHAVVRHGIQTTEVPFQHTNPHWPPMLRCWKSGLLAGP